MTNYYAKLIFKCTWPLLAYALFGVAAKVLRKRGKEDAADSMINFAFLLMFVLYPSISTGLLSSFYCVSIENAGSYLRVDLALDCNTAGHATMIVFTIVMLCVHTIGTPAIYCC